MSIHKTLNCQYSHHVRALSKERGLDECLLQNERGNIIESSSGNLFIVSNGAVLPSAAERWMRGGGHAHAGHQLQRSPMA
ncbi:MAG: aminotransferase class IV [Flavobacteriales bacterium]